ncbi:MAG: DsrE family protein [Deltaproteobacteria bacterium]
MKTRIRSALSVLFLFAFFVLLLSPAFAGGYANALKGVKGVKAVFSVSQGSAKVANVVFWAVKNTYEDTAVKALAEKPRVAVVFHGPAVKLLSADHSGIEEEELGELAKFQDTLKQMKKDGVKLEVCLYAAKVMGVDPATILPEIDQVGNGFISVIGYQEQGYAVVDIP